MDKYGLIGYPLGHSFSVSFFNEKFANEGINARYINFEIPNIEDLPEILASTPELKGLNVTIPYKQKVISYIDELSPEARAIEYGLKALGLETLFVSRTKKDGCITYEEVTPELIKEYNVIVNCTPLGMYPKADTCPDIPYEAMDTHTILYDLIYNPDETLFMKNGAKYGATTKNGLEMLLLQAFASWDFWNGEEQL